MSVDCGIYEIQCLKNNKKYIGSAVDIKRRWYKHRYELDRNIHHNHSLQDDYNKFGGKSFVFSIVELCDKTNLIQREHDYVDEYNCLNEKYGYNLKDPLEGRDFSKPIRYLTDEEIGIAKILLCTGLSVTMVSRICDVSFYTVRSIKSLDMFKDKYCQYNQYLINTCNQPNLIDLIDDLQRLNYDLSKLFNENVWKLISPIPSPIFCNYYKFNYQKKEYQDIEKSFNRMRNSKSGNKKLPKTKTNVKKKSNCRSFRNLNNIKNPYRNAQGEWREKYIK